MSQFTSFSDFNNSYRSASSGNNNFSSYNTNKFYKQNLPEFQLYQENRSHSKHINNNSNTNPHDDENRITATKGIFNGIGGVLGDCNDSEPVTELFFSNENMRRIQKMIRKEVKIRTHDEFSLDVEQDEADLLISMRAVLFNGGRFLPFKIKHQVKELNRKVLNYIIPDIINNMKQEYGYIKEINKPLETMNRPMNVSSIKNLPSITTVWSR